MKVINLTTMALAILLLNNTTSQAVAETPNATVSLDAICKKVNPVVVSKVLSAIRNESTVGNHETVRALKALNLGTGVGVGKSTATVAKLNEICTENTCDVANLTITRYTALPNEGVCRVEATITPQGKRGEIFIPAEAVKEYL